MYINMSVLSLSQRMKRLNFERLYITHLSDDESGQADSSAQSVPSASSPRKRKRCPKGSQRDRKTGKCVSKESGLVIDEDEAPTPLRGPRVKNDSKSVAEVPVYVPYPKKASTIPTSKIIKLLYDGSSMTNKVFCWKLQQIAGLRKSDKYEFSGITKLIYFPTGQVLEDTVLDLVDSYLGSENLPLMKRQTQQGGEPKPYEKDAASRMGLDTWQRIDRPNGFKDMVSADLSLWGHPVKCRCDGLTETHVIEVKAPFGNLYKKWGSGETVEMGSDGVNYVTYDKDAEQFTIPSNYMAQILIEMNCYNRRKAYFGQLYSYKGWYSLAQFFDRQYKGILNGAEYPFPTGTIVYRPCLDKTTPILTIVNRLITVLQSDQLSSSEARACIFTYLYDYCGVPTPPDGSFSGNNARASSLEFKRGEKAAIEDWIEENWRPKLSMMIKELSNEMSMRQYKFIKPDGTVFQMSPYQVSQIRNEMKYGKNKDMIRGEILANQRVLWDGETNSEPQASTSDYMDGLKSLMKMLMNKVRRMDHKKWRRFKFPLMDDDVWGDLPSLEGAKDEFVLLEVDLSEEGMYLQAMDRLKDFFRNCEKVTQGLIPCKRVKGIKETMTGMNQKEKIPIGKKDVFIDFLKKIPCKQVYRKEILI